MAILNYDDYPCLLFVSYSPNDAPTQLPFEAASLNVRDFLAGSQGFNEMFGLIANLNAQGYEPTNFWLSLKQFREVEYNDDFRRRHFRKFASSPPPDVQYGVVSFPERGQYVYLLLPPELGKVKGVTGAYFATALFRGNLFLGFEEAVIDAKVGVMPTGHYANGMDQGGYFSFASIVLSFFADGRVPVSASINSTSEQIWTK